MFIKSTLALALAIESAIAFPFVANQAGVDSSLFKNAKRQQPGQGAQDPASCPVNPNHKGAAKFNAKYPYNGAKNGLPGKGVGGYQVPAPGDTAHAFVAPDYSVDIRGPCPGLNAAANHNFLSHDGITTFTELVDMQQNLYNVGYDLATLLAVLGLTTTDGDIATERLSIGCDATPRTSVSQVLTGNEPGLDGHNKFEADTSLSRNDYFLANGDNYMMNGTLFGMMQDTCQGNFNRDNLALYRYQRYQQSLRDNENFYFGPFSLLLFGASSFLYELMPNGNHNYAPDLETISSFFGAEQQGDGSFTFNGKEKIPDNWTNRVAPYTDLLVGNEIFAQYAEHPVMFGGNTGQGDFSGISGPNGIENGNLTATNPADVMCLIYQLSTERIPSSLNSLVTPTVDAISFAASKLNANYKNLGCPQSLT
ncbi:MAG: hypothetical protein M1828_005298 [Chrysothrix sp. TS-e1954]|nr:MAG: hypothetical protein M1828_005298 [Chrysothrix sp. TS-e1954]